MEPTEINPKFGVCPKCGADMHKVNGKWKCGNCGYEEEI